MNNLYLITRSPFQRTEGITNISLSDKDDGVAFLQDGVVITKSSPEWLKGEIEKAKERGVKFYLLKEDLEARGLEPSQGFEVVNYDELCELILSYKRTVS